MFGQPLVSVICLCFNHARFVEEAITSVLQQTYQNIELIVVDDCSMDNSPEIIKEKLKEFPEIQFIKLKSNMGNCAAFNLAYRRSKGKYIVDLAADDVLMPERVEFGVQSLEKSDGEYGVNFTNAEIISECGKVIRNHYVVNEDGGAIEEVCDGDVFKEVLQRYYICPPTMMFKREVLDKLNGYDPHLTFEDFDFWVRSSRYFKYCYTDLILVKKRKTTNSKSGKQYRLGSKDIHSIFLVLQKAKGLIRTHEEREVLVKRVIYEWKKAAQFLAIRTIGRYFRLLFRIYREKLV
ncbi:glycosyltransferase family 2 protein [Fulvivirga sp. M361]|uniref:glycosyltransferase family 2 protein n=1 Tax=Fulvivirga sp. M361 TaxID=2594266 RepID=UPI0011798FB3|nr:glycosyltransferase family A protein [Fulvivirga sp. M361]TRX57786.1 glycosyltransferase family 2 protein [Fulvivirga sp. M361]